jgi:hypothetical protein
MLALSAFRFGMVHAPKSLMPLIPLDFPSGFSSHIHKMHIYCAFFEQFRPGSAPIRVIRRGVPEWGNPAGHRRDSDWRDERAYLSSPSFR